MNPSQLLAETKTKLSQVTEHFKNELKKLRTGRAHPSMLDGVMVEAYGQPMPLLQVASVAAPEAQLLQIKPFDPNNLSAIAEAIRGSKDLGLNPTDDGHVVRITLPPMTSEDRQRLVKVVHQKLEESLISARNSRHEAFQAAAQAEKARQIGRDELERFKKQVDELMNAQKSQMENLAEIKEQEILTV